MDTDSSKIYKSITAPENIVVIGASNDASKPGGSVTKNIINGNYQGILRVVNPKNPSIMGLPAFKSIADLPDGLDLAIIAIPAPWVHQALLDLAEKHTHTVMIMTAGFGEVSEKGKEEERKFIEIANKHDMTIIGPNCVGILTPQYSGKFAGIIPRLKKGTIDLISASGATVDYMMEQAEVRGLKFSNVISLGNSIQQGVEDLLALTDIGHHENSARIIMIYMESVKKPKKLMKHARSLIQKGCTIIGIKSGVTVAGKRAASSHTGAMSTSDTAVQALFDKSGIIRVYSKREMIDVGCVLSLIGNQVRGNRACVVTDAGGPGVMLSDELNRQGWELPVLKKATQEKLLKYLPQHSSAINPIDCLPPQTADKTRGVFEVLAAEEKENLDVIIILAGNSMLFDVWGVYHEIVNGINNSPIPVIPVLSAQTTTVDLLNDVKSLGKSFFYDEVSAGHALGKILNRPSISEIDPDHQTIDDYDYHKIKNILDNCDTVLTPQECSSLLTAAGIETPHQVEVYQADELSRACDEIGFPLVMKLIGPLHKSDVGGVKVNVQSFEDAHLIWKQMMNIQGAKGILLQQMILGTETIIGVSKEDEFGHLVMFGLGGIYTEVLKDVSFSLCPISEKEGMDMIQRIRSFKLLEGIRGEEGVSVKILADYLVRMAKLVTDFPQIGEIDLNPIKGTGNDLYAVDSRIIIDTENSEEIAKMTSTMNLANP